MARLSRADLEAALAFGAEVRGAASRPDRADLWILERVSRLIGYEVGDYSQHGDTLQPLNATDYPAKASTTPWTDHDWAVIEAEHPFCLYAARSGDPHFSARRATDVIDMRAFRQSEAFELLGYPDRPHVLHMRTPGDAGTQWQVNLARSGSNFSGRDTRMLDALRSPLIAYEDHRALAAIIDELRSMRAGSFDDGVLSNRENEVLDLVANGASNARIAEQLWISPGTVKKHLEHIYLKLEVGSRTAALAQTGRSAAGRTDRREA
jgi:DNA-binding CsgD family transcriptional regulator